jgi:hypothetical protein
VGLDGVAETAIVRVDVNVGDGSFVGIGSGVDVDACVLINAIVDVNCGVDDTVSTFVDGETVDKLHPDVKMIVVKNRQLSLFLLAAIDL